MLNEAIIKNYVDNGIVKDLPIDTTTPKTVLEQLTKTGIKYTWETVKDERVDNQQFVIEVRVYLPGHILYGRHIYKAENANDAHLYAINNAIKTIVPAYENIKPVKPEQSQPAPVMQQSPSTNTPLSQEEILNMIQQENPNTKITTVEQLNNDSREEIPFNEIDLDLNELDNLLTGKTQSIQPQPQQQQSVSHGFTQSQINAINEFKQKMNITNDALLGNYINSWDNKLSRKEDLTPANIDSFIQWTQSVGKAPC